MATLRGNQAGPLVQKHLNKQSTKEKKTAKETNNPTEDLLFVMGVNWP
jgi:hypothetical protein